MVICAVDGENEAPTAVKIEATARVEMMGLRVVFSLRLV